MEQLVTHDQLNDALRPLLELVCSYGNGFVELRFATDLHVYEMAVDEACPALNQLNESVSGTPTNREGIDQ